MKLLAAILIIALTSCASYGNKIDANYVDKIEKNKTTEQEIINNLGAPMSVAVTPDGLKMMMYMYSFAAAKPSSYIPFVGAFAGGTQTRTQMLQIWIDEKGLVKNFAFNDGTNDINTGILAN